MIETFSFSHSGGLPEYLDKVYVSYGKYTYAIIVNGMNNLESRNRVAKAIHDTFDNNVDNYTFSDISNEINSKVRSNDEFLVVRINDESIITEQHGGTRGYLIHDGNIVRLTNGLIKLQNEDRLIIGTDRFFSTLTDEMVLVDSLTSFSAEEWMDFLVCRISEVNMLSGTNLSAVTIIVRNTENVRLA